MQWVSCLQSCESLRGGGKNHDWFCLTKRTSNRENTKFQKGRKGKPILTYPFSFFKFTKQFLNHNSRTFFYASNMETARSSSLRILVSRFCGRFNCSFSNIVSRTFFNDNSASFCIRNGHSCSPIETSVR